MGKFVIGLIIGGIAGIMAMTVNPNLAQELRGSLASVTALVMRSAEEAAEDVGDAAEGVSNEAGDTARPTTRDAPAPVPQPDAGRDTTGAQ